MEPEIYWMCAVRLPRWSPDLRERLVGAKIDRFREPESYGNEPVEITLELCAASEADARARIRSALAPAGARLMPGDFGPFGTSSCPPPDRFQPRPPLQD